MVGLTNNTPGGTDDKDRDEIRHWYKTHYENNFCHQPDESGMCLVGYRDSKTNKKIN
jgi:hypothetical protein